MLAHFAIGIRARLNRSRNITGMPVWSWGLTDMQTFLQRSIWLAVWAATMAITIWLSVELADSQPVLLAIIVLAAVVVSVSMYYARSTYRDGNKVTAGGAFTVGLLALAVSVIAGTSYWSSSIEGVSAEVAREKSALQAKDMVREKRRQQLAKASLGKSPEQIAAEMQGM